MQRSRKPSVVERRPVGSNPTPAAKPHPKPNGQVLDCKSSVASSILAGCFRKLSPEWSGDRLLTGSCRKASGSTPAASARRDVLTGYAARPETGWALKGALGVRVPLPPPREGPTLACRAALKAVAQRWVGGSIPSPSATRGVVQRKNGSLISCERGFDSLRPDEGDRSLTVGSDAER